MTRTFILAATAVLALSSAAAAQTAVPPLGDDIKPARMSGMGLNVKDLEKAKGFYSDVLGYKVAAKVPGKDGQLYEYLLSFSGNVGPDALLVLTKKAPDAGSTSFGRVILVVPNGRKLAERVVAAGGSAAKIADGTNIVKDPDGNVIELYQRPAPKPPG